MTQQHPTPSSLHGVAGEDRLDLSKDEQRYVRRRSWRLLGRLAKPVRKQLILTMVTVMASSAMRASFPLIVALGIDWALPLMVAGNNGPAFLAAGAYLLAGILAGVLTAWYTVLTAKLSQAMLLDLRLMVFRHTQRLSLEFHETYTSGRVISRQTSDLEALRELLDQGVAGLVAGFMTMAFTVASVFILDVPSGFVVLTAIVPIYFITRWYQHRSSIQYRSSRVTSARMIVHFVETMTGIRAVKAFRRQQANNVRYDELTNAYRKNNIAALMLNSIYQPTLLGIGNIMVAAVLLVSGLRVLDGNLELGVLIALAMATKRVFQPFEQLTQFYSAFQSATAALEKVSGLLEEAPSVTPPKDPQPLAAPAGAIDFTQASFGYGTGPEILPKFDLHIPAGQTVAIVGSTGAGKSTLVKLIARFYDLTSGSLTLDGVPINRLSDEDLRRAVVMVTQESFLFSGSIRDNIALGKPEASDEEIVLAARAVGAHEFICALPDGYDTDVNKRGGRLSAGQRQLVSFARAFLADPTVLILDEATSSMDLPSERLVQAALDQLLGNRTAVIIAHRLSTVANADRVLVVDAGRIVEDGSPAELIAAGGRFAQLYQAWEESQQQEN
ncbi:ABC transporter ATP-binding protein [Micrococcoides hystricis]|uniref:ABC transporter ATP-binding protein n=1 Tax=Micrococcoides hystricis TaxID=1572761 RepID=A0ABV6PD20_9MICC